MKLLKIAFLLTITILLNSCASSYKIIDPTHINYNSKNENKGVTLEYKYNLLNKKYAKKENKNGIRLVAIKIKNNSERDLIFGENILLTDSYGKQILIYENTRTVKMLKQKPASYLLYLLLTPMNLYTSNTNSRGMQETTSSTPIGLVVGPGLAAGNMITASSSNKRFETEVMKYDILGQTIKKGETVHGLIGIISDNFEYLKLKIE